MIASQLSDKRVPQVAAKAQHSLVTSFALHLLPGVAILIFYFLAAPLVERLGYPSTLAGSLSILLILAPLELGFLFASSKQLTNRFSLNAAVPYRRPVPLWQYLIFVPLLYFWYFTISSAWGNIQFEMINNSPWLPAWLVNPFASQDPGSYTSQAMKLTAIFGVITSGFIAPVVEEYYFRGYLLPRIDRFGFWAVLINTVLFAVHHLWTPFLTPGRILAWLPIVFLTWRKQNIFPGMIVHFLTNLVSIIGIFTSALGSG